MAGEGGRWLNLFAHTGAFSVALLLTDVGEAGLRRDWFGWRGGAIAARGCYELAHDD